jgi:proprotein convertase subtilisin/kexin type 5
MLAVCCQIDGCTACNDGYCDSCSNCVPGYVRDLIPPSSYRFTCYACSARFHSACLTCNKTHCLSCAYPWELNPTNTSCQCSTYGYTSGPLCLPCLDGCASCTNGATCNSCKPFFDLSPDQTICTPCITGCAFCSSSTTCDSCNVDFAKSGPVGNVLCNTCTGATFWKPDYLCHACNTAKCATCKGKDTFCTSCAPGLTLFPAEGICVNTGCGFGNYFDFNAMSCKPCAPECKGCSDSYAGNYECKDCNMAYNPKLHREDLYMGACRIIDKASNISQFVNLNGTEIVPYYSIPGVTYSRFEGRLIGYWPRSITMSSSTGSIYDTYGCGAKITYTDANCLFCSYDFAWSTPTTCGGVDRYAGDYPHLSGGYEYYDPLGGNTTCRILAQSLCVDCISTAIFDTTGTCVMRCKIGQFGNNSAITCTATVPNCISFDTTGLCIKCIDGFYYDSTNIICAKCTPGCKKCTDSTSAGCLQCSAGYHKILGVCKMRCPNGFYYDSGTTSCLLSNNFCKTSDLGSLQCTSCANSSLFLLGQTCFMKCPFGQYYEITNTSCSTCHSSCKTCIGAGINDCTSCNKSMTLSSNPGTCVDITCAAALTTAGCLSCSGTSTRNCIVPQTGKYLNNYNNQPVVYFKLAMPASFSIL